MKALCALPRAAHHPLAPPARGGRKRCLWWLGRALLQHAEELVDLLDLVGGVAAADGIVDAVLDMILEHLVLHFPERRTHGLELGQDVDAVALFLDHALDAPHLSFDTAQAGAARG